MLDISSILLVTSLDQDLPREVEKKIRSIETDMERDCFPAPLWEVLKKALPEEEQRGNPLDSTKLIDLFVLLSGWTEYQKKVKCIPSEEVHAIPVSSRELDKRIGHDYSRYLSFLQRNGVIVWQEGRDGYQTGEMCKYLAIKPPYFSAPVAVVKYKGTKYTQKRKEKGLDLLTLGDRHRYCVLKEYVNVKLEKALLFLTRAETKAESENQRRQLAARKDLLVQLSIHKISYRCDAYGRRHTQFTRMTKEDRGFLQIDGEDIGSIDIRSSQIQFLWALLNRITHMESKGGCRGTEAKGGCYVLRVSSVWEKALNFRDTEALREELSKFRKDLDQDIYRVAPAWLLEDKQYSQRQFDALKIGVREKGKALVLKALFGTHNPQRKKLLRCWEKRYPIISKALKFSKDGTTDAEKNLLSHALQSFESWVVLEEIGGELETRGIRCIYIHDSVLCPFSKIEEATQVFRDKLAGYGLYDVLQIDRIMEPSEYVSKNPRPRRSNWKKHRNIGRAVIAKPAFSRIHSM